MLYPATATYTVSYASAEALDVGMEEFDTYSEAKQFSDIYEMSGYSVQMREVVQQ